MSPPDGRDDPRSAAVLANETERGSDSTANLPQRLERYGKAKERALSMHDFIRSRGVVDHHTGEVRFDRLRHKLLRELRECGNYLVFREYVETGRIRLHAMRSCGHHLLCPFCAIRRGVKLVNRYHEKLQTVLQENPGLVPHMLNFTVRNGVDLHQVFAHLQHAVRELYKRRYRNRESEAKKILGAAWAYEFKRGSGSDLWHPHSHAVVLCRREAPLDQWRLSAEWLEITADSFIVETHPMYGDPRDAFMEVFKYALKFGDLPLADNWTGYQTLRRRRLIGAAGLLYGIDEPTDLTDDEFENAGAWIELFFRFYRGGGYVHSGCNAHSLQAA